ncbi:MAG: aspartate aminotransferase, partial [Buttiauxella noackiae]|nr:aspartate aminotransferase [Buttiauxella noackiae]
LGFSPGADFGEAKFVRINFGCTFATLNEAIKRMEAAVRSVG